MEHAVDQSKSSGPRGRYAIAITGATGAIFGVRMLQRLAAAGVETHLIVSQWGRRTIEHETPYTVEELRRTADVVHSIGDQAATLSSGSFRLDGMVIAPCSVRTMAAIAHGLADNLITRTADVVLKERRKLVLMVREAPLSDIHLRNMLAASQAGAVIFPPMPAFYNRPQSIDDVVDHIVGRTMDQLGLDPADLHRWDGRLDRMPPRPAGRSAPDTRKDDNMTDALEAADPDAAAAPDAGEGTAPGSPAHGAGHADAGQAGDNFKDTFEVPPKAEPLVDEAGSSFDADPESGTTPESFVAE